MTYAEKMRRLGARRRRYLLILLVLAGVLVFAVGLLSKKTAAPDPDATEPTYAAYVVTATTAPLPLMTDAPETLPTEPPASETTEPPTTEPPTTEPPTTEPPTTEPPRSFRADTEHLYIRVNREKPVTLFGVIGKEIVWSVDDPRIASVDQKGNVTALQQGECTVTAAYGDEIIEIPVTVRVMSTQDGCTFVDGILVANKSYSLPESYDPGLLPVTDEAFQKLSADAKAEGLDIYAASDYRTYQFQVTVYNSMVKGYSKEYADSYSARPGHSEHQTGYTIDCNDINNVFADTDEGKWLAEHCWEYGFIIRYPLGKEHITGYSYESWHIRYVGVEHAKAIWEQGLTLEEYLDIDSVYQD